MWLETAISLVVLYIGLWTNGSRFIHQTLSLFLSRRGWPMRLLLPMPLLAFLSTTPTSFHLPCPLFTLISNKHLDSHMHCSRSLLTPSLTTNIFTFQFFLSYSHQQPILRPLVSRDQLCITLLPYLHSHQQPTPTSSHHSSPPACTLQYLDHHVLYRFALPSTSLTPYWWGGEAGLVW